GSTITAETTKRNIEVTQAPNRKGVMIQEPEEITTTKTASSQQPQVQDKSKRKAKLIEEPVKLKKKDQILFDEEKDEAETAQESSSKRAGDELDQEISKKQKVKDDKESEEHKKCLEIIPDNGDDVTIDATPFSSKSPTIVDYKIYKERKKNYFQIFKADGNSQMYLTFSKLLKNFDREDQEVLWRLVKDIFVKTKPLDDMDSFILYTLKTMFEHHVEDNVWKNQQGLTQ
nr:hypothetical protein [Tanacetum cinerariifolium]